MRVQRPGTCSTWVTGLFITWPARLIGMPPNNVQPDGWTPSGSAKAAVVEAPVGDWSARSGYELGRRLADAREVTAIFAANDLMAVGLLRALSEAGRRVPDDVSIVGFDDMPLAAYLSPPLTTVRQDVEELGRRGVQMLLGLVAGSPHATVVAGEIEPLLVVRGSTAPPPKG